MFDPDLIEHCYKNISHTLRNRNLQGEVEPIIKWSDSTPRMQGFLPVSSSSGKWQELVICISSLGTCAHTLIRFPVRLLGPCEVSVHWGSSLSLSLGPLCAYGALPAPVFIWQKSVGLQRLLSSKRATDWGWAMDAVPLSVSAGGPEGGLETLAVEMLASPGRALCVFLLFCYSK